MGHTAIKTHYSSSQLIVTNLEHISLTPKSVNHNFLNRSNFFGNMFYIQKYFWNTDNWNGKPQKLPLLFPSPSISLPNPSPKIKMIFLVFNPVPFSVALPDACSLPQISFQLFFLASYECKSGPFTRYSAHQICWDTIIPYFLSSSYLIQS